MTYVEIQEMLDKLLPCSNISSQLISRDMPGRSIEPIHVLIKCNGRPRILRTLTDNAISCEKGTHSIIMIKNDDIFNACIDWNELNSY